MPCCPHASIGRSGRRGRLARSEFAFPQRFSVFLLTAALGGPIACSIADAWTDTPPPVRLAAIDDEPRETDEPEPIEALEGAAAPSSHVGAALYERKCSRCHALYNPGSYGAAEWPSIVRSMKSQAALSPDDINAISEYLVQAARESGANGGIFSGGQGPMIGGYLYTEYFQTPSKKSNFDIHYLTVSLSGWANDKIYYYGELELEHGGVGGNNTFVEQAYIDYWFCPNIAIKIGALLTPFNRFDEFHDPISNYTITRPQMAREIGVSAWKDVGVDLHGYFDAGECYSFVYDYYIINGLGAGDNLRGSRQYRDNNENLAHGGRLRMIYKSDLELGFSGYRGAWDDEGQLDLTMFGTHFMARTPIADFYGEFSWADSQNPLPTANGRISGYFVQASRLFCDRYRPTIRVGSLDYLDPGNLRGRDPADGNKDLREVVLAFAYYPTPKVAFKIEYAFFIEGSRKTTDANDQLGFQAAIRY